MMSIIILKVDLTVIPNNNVTVIGTVKLKINGQSMIDVRIDEKNFNKKTPFSIRKHCIGFKQGNVKHNNNQAVKKFLGDYLQGMEAIKHGYIYYSGDKPATAMYDWMKLIFLPQKYPHLNLNGNSIGGFVSPNGNLEGKVSSLTGLQTKKLCLGGHMVVGPHLLPILQIEEDW